MLKGDLKKVYGVWHVVYFAEKSGRIKEIKVTDYSSRMISEKKGDNIKYCQDVYFDITSEGRAAIKFVPNLPPTKKTKEQEKPRAIKESLDDLMLRNIPVPPQNNSSITDNDSVVLDNSPFYTIEELTMKHLVSAYEEFSKLDQTNPNDIKDFVFHINALQRILGQRVLRRDYPNTFPTY